MELLQKDFNRLSAFIHSEYGIEMPPMKRLLLESRLQKRLRDLGMGTFKEYCDYLFSKEGKDRELIHFIDKITTNKTDFFRESDHFDFLLQKTLPGITGAGSRLSQPLRIWSAGCSTGEEPYTLAMVLNEFQDANPSARLQYSILGTDISMEVLKIAKEAIYSESRVAPIPMAMKKKYLLKSKERRRKLVKIVPNLRKKIQFMRLNLMDSSYSIEKQFDIVFCRNVIIYFDKKTQEEILKKLCGMLKVGGYFFQGHSESTHGFQLPLKAVYPTIYERTSH